MSGTGGAIEPVGIGSRVVVVAVVAEVSVVRGGGGVVVVMSIWASPGNQVLKYVCIAYFVVK